MMEIEAVGDVSKEDVMDRAGAGCFWAAGYYVLTAILCGGYLMTQGGKEDKSRPVE